MFSASSLRLFFWISVIWGAAIFWVAPHPPMVDLPQHAGQISLLHDLATGQSNWSNLVRVNLFTPYLLGYGLAFPLTFIFSPATSIKIVLSVAFLCFVVTASALRKKFNSDERIDWLLLIGFFGFAYSWGLYTFLVSAPVALLVIIYSFEYATSPTPRKGIILAISGFALLASHGLTFIFACSVGGLIYVVKTRSIKAFFTNLWPFVFLLIACGLYFIGSRITEAELAAPYGSHVSWAFGKHRVHELVLHSFGIAPTPLFVMAAIVLLLTPWLLGLKINWLNKSCFVMLFVVVLISFFVPNFALKTALLYQRFALFFFPAYVLLFVTKKGIEKENSSTIDAARKFFVMPLIIVTCWAVLASYTLEAQRFAKESEEIDAIIGKIEPGSRVLALIFSPESSSIKNPTIYSNYASWYQAERKGFVDFNFAWFPPQIVRFKPGNASSVDINFVPAEFDWKKHNADQYRYFIVRQATSTKDDLFKGAVCSPTLVASTMKWGIYEKSLCNK